MLLAYAKSQRYPILVRGHQDPVWPRLDPPTQYHNVCICV